MNNTRKKIAIIDMDNLKNVHWGTGQARATREIFKRLSDKYDIEIYCSKYPGYQDYEECGIKHIHVGIEHKNPQLTNLIFVLNIPFLVRTIKADIIIENFNAPASVSFSPVFTKLPVIAIPTMFNAMEFTKKYHFPFHWIEAFGLKFYKYMTAYSDIDSAKIKRLNPEIIQRNIPVGVGEEFFAIEHNKPKHILFLGRLDIYQKGVDLLIEAYAEVKDSIGYPLVIAGHGSDEEKLKAMVKKFGLEDRVTFAGSTYGDKKMQLISDALFVAFPSRHDELSLWALEALASGMPIVSFDLPEGRWMTDKVALKAKPFDTDEYAKLLVKASEPVLNNKMRNEARAFAKQYSWDKVTGQFDSFISEILTKKV